jgi:putative DNA methylase
MYPVKTPKKLIEVALPLDAINVASAKEKSIRHGHPSTLHLWWARRPLATARAVIFAQMVNDPGGERGYFAGMTKAQAAVKREELFKIIEDLVLWENTNNEEVLGRAQAAIRESWRETCRLNKGHPQAAELFNPEILPSFHDPFAGGGALPLEAQRLGLDAFASDLNPVAVTINKAMIEIPPKFTGRAPVGPFVERDKQSKLHEDWAGARGLAEDTRRYGSWMRAEAQARIGHLYPAIEVTDAMVSDIGNPRPDLVPFVGERLTVIAWIWARTIRSPNPAVGNVEVPLASTFLLSTKDSKQVYLRPLIDEGHRYRFQVRLGEPDESAKDGTKLARGANFRCLLSNAPIEPKHIYSEASAGRMGARLMAMVAESASGRVYLEPTPEHEAAALAARPEWKPEVLMPENPRWFSPPLYGLKAYGDLFTQRQLFALTTLCDLVSEATELVRTDAVRAGWPDDGVGLAVGGTGATAYAEAIGVYLSFCVDKNTLTNTSLATWQKDPDRLTQAYSRQAIAMTWDFAEANPLSDAGGGFLITADAIAKVLHRLPAHGVGLAYQQDAALNARAGCVVSTDPPYYDNIGYADLSDYFYVWMRRNLRKTFPDTFATVAVPKAAELVAVPYRHGGKAEAEAFFLNGMTSAMHRLALQSHPALSCIHLLRFQAVGDAGAYRHFEHRVGHIP